jgi:hypothetical protein
MGEVSVQLVYEFLVVEGPSSSRAVARHFACSQRVARRVLFQARYRRRVRLGEGAASGVWSAILPSGPKPRGHRPSPPPLGDPWLRGSGNVRWRGPLAS